MLFVLVLLYLGPHGEPRLRIREMPTMQICMKAGQHELDARRALVGHCYLTGQEI